MSRGKVPKQPKGCKWFVLFLFAYTSVSSVNWPFSEDDIPASNHFYPEYSSYVTLIYIWLLSSPEIVIQFILPIICEASIFAVAVLLFQAILGLDVPLLLNANRERAQRALIYC